MSDAKLKIISDWSQYYLQPDKDRKGIGMFRIRRYRTINGKTQWETFKGEYDRRASRTTLERELVQINIRTASESKKAEKAYTWRHSFITEELMEEFKDHLQAQIPSKEWQSAIYYYARKNLNWFIEKCNQPDPLEWKGLQDKWSRALFSRLNSKEIENFKLWEVKVHPVTVSKQVQAINKLLGWLHDKDPSVFPSVRLKPYSKAMMKDYRSRWKEKLAKGKFIEILHQEIILKNISSDIQPFVWFGLKFGLRRQESMAIREKNIRAGHLLLDEQLTRIPDRLPTFEPLKDDDHRKIPYWFTTTKEAYEVMKRIKLMHPSTFSHKWIKEMKRLNLDYGIHDLRRTFITNAFRAAKNSRDIQLAVGHENITTTMQYAQDDRVNSDDVIYSPEDAA